MKREIKVDKKDSARLEALIDSMPHLVWFNDENSKYVRVNKAFAKRIGKNNPSVIAGKKIDDFWPEKVAKKFLDENRRILKTKELIKRNEVISRGKNGGKSFFETVKGPVLNKRGEIVGVFGVSFDVTRYKEAEKTIKENEEKFRCLIENLDHIVYSLDKNGKVKYVSPAVENILGYKTEEVLGKNFLKFIYKKDIPKVQEFSEHFLGQKKGEMECRMIKKNGDSVWVKNFSRMKCKMNDILEVSGLIADISQQKENEGKLLESYEYLGDINRRISIFLNFEKILKEKSNREGVVDIVLKSLLEISKSDIIALCRYDKKKKRVALTNKIFRENCEKKTRRKDRYFEVSKQALKFLDNIKENEIRMKKWKEEAVMRDLKINEKVDCFFTIPLFFKKDFYGFAVFMFRNEKKLEEHEVKFNKMLSGFLSFIFSELRYHEIQKTE